jgi:hypothetical protein
LALELLDLAVAHLQLHKKVVVEMAVQPQRVHQELAEQLILAVAAAQLVGQEPEAQVVQV